MSWKSWHPEPHEHRISFSAMPVSISEYANQWWLNTPCIGHVITFLYDQPKVDYAPQLYAIPLATKSAPARIRPSALLPSETGKFFIPNKSVNVLRSETSLQLAEPPLPHPLRLAHKLPELVSFLGLAAPGPPPTGAHWEEGRRVMFYLNQCAWKYTWIPLTALVDILSWTISAFP